MRQSIAVSPVPTTSNSPRERRAEPRTAVSLHGKLHVRGSYPSHCTIVDISPGGACVETASIPDVGEEVVLDIACTGRIRGVVVRNDPFDFGVQFTLCDEAKSRLADQIAIQFNKNRFHFDDRRASEREDAAGRDPVHFDDGTVEQARIKDVSITGVAFFSENRPRIGLKLRVGVLTGKVVRHLDDGYAVAFDPPTTPV